MYVKLRLPTPLSLHIISPCHTIILWHDICIYHHHIILQCWQPTRMKRMNHPNNPFSSWSLGLSGWMPFVPICSLVFASCCWFLLYFSRFFHPRGPVNTAYCDVIVAGSADGLRRPGVAEQGLIENHNISWIFGSRPLETSPRLVVTRAATKKKIVKHIGNYKKISVFIYIYICSLYFSHFFLYLSYICYTSQWFLQSQPVAATGDLNSRQDHSWARTFLIEDMGGRLKTVVFNRC